MSVKECSGCEQPAVGFVERMKVGTEQRQLVCAECMKALMADGVEVRFLEVRHDRVDQVKKAIKEGLYDEATIEGAMALNLAVDKLIERQKERAAWPDCKWDAHRRALAECQVDGCFLDRRYHELTGVDLTECRHVAYPGVEGSVLCDRLGGHEGPHSVGWGRSVKTWAECPKGCYDPVEAPKHKNCSTCGGRGIVEGRPA